MRQAESYIDATIALARVLGLRRAAAFVHASVGDPSGSFQDAGLECRSFQLQANSNVEIAIRDWAGHLARSNCPVEVLYLDGWPVGFTRYKELHREVLDCSKHLLSATALICVSGSAADHGGKAQLVVPLAEQLGFTLLASDHSTLLVRPDRFAALDTVTLPVPRFDSLTFADALKLHRQGYTWQAQRLYLRLLEREPAHAQSLHMLGLTYHQEGRTQQALECLRRASAALVSDPLVWNNLGAVELASMQLPDARRSFQRALSLRPNYIDASCNLAKVEIRLGNTSEAEQVLRTGLIQHPDHLPLLKQLADLLSARGAFEEAMLLLSRALADAPSNRTLKLELAAVAMQANQLIVAANHFQTLVEAPSVPPAIRLNYAKVLAETDQIKEANEQLELACHSPAVKPAWRLRQALLCPAVMPSASAIDEYREKLSTELDRWIADAPSISPQDLVHLDCYPPFALSFQGREHRPLKERFAHLFRQWVTPINAQPKPGKKRIGFVVTRGHESVFLRCTGAIVNRLSGYDLQPVILCAASGEARLRQALNDPAIEFHSFTDELAVAVDVISHAGCHLLFYWEIGSDALNYILPFYRLAPVQVTSWGTQVTSGIHEVDRYLSSELIESADAQRHYTERLVQLKSLPTYQARVRMPAMLSREQFKLPADRRIYLCPQTILKLHPEQDELFRGVLESDQGGVLVLKEGRYPAATQKLKHRLEQSLGESLKRVIFVPWQTHEDYLRLLQHADVVLDTRYFSGGTTTYDIFSANQLIVTWPGEWNIGRYVAACYRKLGIPDLIVNSSSDYVKAAITLATDVTMRSTLREQLKQRDACLFNDASAIEEHACTFMSLANGR